MTAIYVRNQDELDAALNNSEYTYCEHEIMIDSPSGVWLTVRDSRGLDVRAYESATVRACGAATVETYWVAKLASRFLPTGWSLHTLRHRFATRAYAADRDIIAVQRLLGHTSVTTTQRYTNPPDNAMRQAAAAAPTPTTSFYDQQQAPTPARPDRWSQQPQPTASAHHHPQVNHAAGCGSWVRAVGPDGARRETPSMAEKAPRLTPHRKILVTPLAPLRIGKHSTAIPLAHPSNGQKKLGPST